MLPCFIIVLSYSCIFWTVRKQNQKMSKFDTLAPKTKTRFFKNKNDLKLTIMMLTIFICFVLCFLPLMLVNVFDDDTKYPTLHILASVFAWSSAVINPIIYAVGSSQYRYKISYYYYDLNYILTILLKYFTEMPIKIFLYK